MRDDDAPLGAAPRAKIFFCRATALAVGCAAAILCGLSVWTPAEAFTLEPERLRISLDHPIRPLPVRSTYSDKWYDPAFGNAWGRGTTSLVLATPPGMEKLRVWNVMELRAALAARGYRLAAVRAGKMAVPRLGLAALPRDIDQVDGVSLRKSLFLRSVLPLVLLVNEELRALRQEVIHAVRQAAGPGGLSQRRRAWLADLAVRYGVDFGAWTALLQRVDTVPVSLALAQAVQESGWGRSRFARSGNALFGQRTWSDDVPGLVPDERDDDAEHRVRAFPDLLSAVRTYMHNLNTHDAYAEFRLQRAAARDRGEAPDPLRLAEKLTRYAEHGDGYVEALHTIMRENRLIDFDRARLTYPDRTKLADLN